MIDAKTYGTYNHEDMPKLEPFSGTSQVEDDEHFHEYHRSFSEFDSDSNDSAPPKYRTPKPRSSQPQIVGSSSTAPHFLKVRPSNTQETEPTPLPDTLLIYTTPMLRGYCLTTKQWVSLYITNITEITWNPHAFSSLVLPHDYKELVLAFVESQLNGKDQFDDIVQGKGQGIIMLLSGEPGVGKTLTAESGMSSLSLHIRDWNSLVDEKESCGTNPPPPLLPQRRRVGPHRIGSRDLPSPRVVHRHTMELHTPPRRM